MARWIVGFVSGLLIAGCSAGAPSPSPNPTGASSAPVSTPTLAPTATPMPTATAAPVEPASGRIAFRRVGATNAEGFEQTDLFLVDADGSNLLQLTNDRRIETYLYWLRDGRLVFAWERPNDPYHQFLAVIQADGAGRTELGAVQTGYGDPAISPDGGAVAFGGDGDSSGETGVVLLDLVSGERRALTTDGAYQPIWSPDGTRLMVQLGSGRIGILDVTTRKYVRQVGTNVVGILGWMPDGSAVLFKACTDDMNKLECMAAPVLIAGLDGSGPRVLRDPLPMVVVGLASPDGAWLAQRDPDCTLKIVARADATEVALDAAGETNAGCSGRTGGVSWSPDSRWLALSRGRLVLITPLGTDRVEITEGPDDGQPAWQPAAKDG